jgi:hypothetical protein
MPRCGTFEPCAAEHSAVPISRHRTLGFVLGVALQAVDRSLEKRAFILSFDHEEFTIGPIRLC